MKNYLALSVVAPAGVRIRSGKKRIEVRQWWPDVLPLRDLLIVENDHRLSSAGLREDQNGRVMALVDVEAVTEWKPEDLAAAMSSYWDPGWLAWHLTNVRPVRCAGNVPAKLRLYEVEVTIELSD